MKKVVGISFNKGGKIYFFNPEKNNICKKSKVIVETERGMQFGTVETEILEIEEEKIKGELKKIIRIATSADVETNKKNILDSKNALEKCKKLIKKYKLNMQAIDANYTFDRSQLVFKFLSDNRIDFRDLAKELANIYKTRIELRQVGARDKAREIGGCGMCGRKLCCSSFLEDLESVSINMAKNQNISLNPSKINGLCGRLLCCLKYENLYYKENKKGMPEIGKTIKTDKGEGKVVSIDILNRTYTVDILNVGYVTYLCDNNGKN